MEHRYVFSGSLSKKVVEYLRASKPEPLDMLVTQLDRSGIENAKKLKEEGIVKSLMVDSGAFSAHTKGIKLDIDDYIKYLNDNDEWFDTVVAVDVIPGHADRPKTEQDYLDAAKASWENFVYMYYKLKSPHKLIATYHRSEPIESLENMLTWTDKDGKHLEYIGIGGVALYAGDIMEVMGAVEDCIKKHHREDIKLHIFGMTNISVLNKIRWFSADSTSCILRAAYGQIITKKYGTQIISTARPASYCLNKADEKVTNDILQDIKDCGLTLEEVQNDSAARTVMNIINTQYLLNTSENKQVKRRMKLI